MDRTEAELEKFRKEWREEVTRRSRTQRGPPPQQQPPPPRSSKQHLIPAKGLSRVLSVRTPRDGLEERNEIEPVCNHDLGETQRGQRVRDELDSMRSIRKEPTTALEHYEKAVEKEGQGSLGDSVSLYRKAFRLDDCVHEKYKNKHFPASSHAQAKTHNRESIETPAVVATRPGDSLATLTLSTSDLTEELAGFQIAPEPPPTELSPSLPCPIADIPEEILTDILLNLAVEDVASFARLAQVCKRLAFLVITEDSVWRDVVQGQCFGFPAMHYRYACSIMGEALPETKHESATTFNTVAARFPCRTLDILPLIPEYPTYRHMFRLRPRIRFNGCYISTVNYTRPGAGANSWNWNAPVLIVTYFRYLRFFRDGTVISLLTTSEPQDVVPHIHKEHLLGNHTGNLPQSVMRDALKGRWRLTGDPFKEKHIESSETEPGETVVRVPEEEGEVIIETEGVVPRYMYKMRLGLTSAGRGARNNKLMWKSYWSYNRLTDDWSEFGLKNDRAFYWSRVKSYNIWE